MSNGGTKFTLYEADVALYPSDANDEVVGDAVYLGCCWERVELSRSYTVRDRPFLGARFQQSYNENEAHTIELSNPEQVGALDEIKSLDRFGRYILVVVWHDEEINVWLKRTYFGVTDVSEQVGGEVVVGNATGMRAERMVQAPGRNVWPTMTPQGEFGVVYYVLGQSRTPLYGYGNGAVFFELPTFNASMGEITPASGTLSFFVEGALAMQANELLSGTLLVRDLIATGGSFYDTPLGKLEFEINGIRVATLAKDGTLAVPDIAEVDAAPADPADIELRLPPLGDWVASFRLGVTVARNFSEFLP